MGPPGGDGVLAKASVIRGLGARCAPTAGSQASLVRSEPLEGGREIGDDVAHLEFDDVKDDVK